MKKSNSKVKKSHLASGGDDYFLAYFNMFFFKKQKGIHEKDFPVEQYFF
jgi:hypothetical protein